MIVGLGEDIVSLERIQKLLGQNEERFLKRCYSEAEIKQANSIENEILRIAWLAKRFAAKEACAKALGTGISGGMNFFDIETLNDPSGRPIQNLYGVALETLHSRIPKAMQPRIHVSLSDELPLAKAIVIIEAI